MKSITALAGEYSAIAFALPVSILVGYAIGYYLDQFFGTHFLYIVFLVFGIAAGFLQIYRLVSKENKEEDGE